MIFLPKIHTDYFWYLIINELLAGPWRRPDNHTDMSEYWTGIPRAESEQETKMVVPT